jgi:hypothetical protein
LEGEAGVFDCLVFACVDQRRLDRRVDVVEECDDVVALDDRAYLSGNGLVTRVIQAGVS